MRKIVLCLVMVATLATNVVFGQEEAEEKKVNRTITAYLQMEYLEAFNKSMNDKYSPVWNEYYDPGQLWTQYGARYGQNYIFGQEWLSAGITIYKNTSGRAIGLLDVGVSGKAFGVDNFNFMTYVDSELTYGFETGWYGQKAGPVTLSFYVGGEFHGWDHTTKEIIPHTLDRSDDWFEKVYCGIGYRAAFNSVFGISGKVEYTWEDATLYEAGTITDKTFVDKGITDPGHLKIDVYLTANLGYGVGLWGGMRFYLIERNLLDPRAGINYTYYL